MQYSDLCKHLFEKGIHKSYDKSKNASISTQRKGKEKKGKEIYREFDHLSLTIVEFERLKTDGYTQEQIDHILDKIENYKLNKNYKSLNLTLRDWIKKEYNLNQNKPAVVTEDQKSFIEDFYKRPNQPPI